MIEDEKLRELFKNESEEHLQHLDDALLQLEKTPADQALLEDAFREAHSLKGAARMLGLNDIQSPAHALEDELNAARQGVQSLTPETLARMSDEEDAIRRMALEAVTGPAGSDTTPEPAPEPEPRVEEVSSDSVTPPPPTAPAAPFHIDSVRVDTRKLDTLMTHAGELTVTRTRVAHRLTDIDELIDMSEDWLRRETARRQGGYATEATADVERIMAPLTRLRTGLGEDSARLDYIAGELESGIRLARLLPMSNVFRLFPRLVHDLAREQDKEVELIITGEETNADKRILEEIKDPLMHILRNSVDHGIEAPQIRENAGKQRRGRITLTASQTASSVEIEVRDDGCGLDEDAIRRSATKRGLATTETLAAMSPAEIQEFIFAPGMSTSSFVTDISGRGVGMGVVRTNVERLKGTLELQSTPGEGTSIRITLPITVATVRVLIVEVNGQPYGLPAECVQVMTMVAPDLQFAVEGHKTIMHQGQPVSVARLIDLLELPHSARTEKAHNEPVASPCVILSQGGETFGVLVDVLLDEQEVVLKPQSSLLERVRNVAGATILDSGEICMVLNPLDLLDSMRKVAVTADTQNEDQVAEKKKSVLLAEDSIVTRTQETRILENAGYEVVAAADGLEAWNKLATRSFDAVVSDIVMPNLDGLGLTEKIRRETRYAELPIILVTSLASDDDRRRGLEAGANAYLTKPAFDQKLLLDCLDRLI